jgi:hypothetical protein
MPLRVSSPAGAFPLLVAVFLCVAAPLRAQTPAGAMRPGPAQSAAGQSTATPASDDRSAAPPPRAARPDTRTQYPALLRNSYVSLHVGYIDYPFSARQLESGFQAGAIGIPHVSVQLALFGHQFTRYLAIEAAYMRPVSFVSYKNINGVAGGHHVFMSYGGASLRLQHPVSRRVSVSGELGIGVSTRAGFEQGGVTVVRSASFGSAVVGAGLDFHVNPRWDLTAGTTFRPADGPSNQPRTLFTSGGFRYILRPLPDARVMYNRDGGYIFPERLLQLELTSGVGYGVNNFLSRTVPVFYGGNVEVDRGFAVHYDQNLFHSRTRFSIDAGLSAGTWRSRDNRDRFWTLSIYPLLRLTFLRTTPFDLYAQYSLAGPSFISRAVIDNRGTGRRFTFQDFVGIGAFVGKRRNLSVGLKINHYSNGNLFTENAGVKIPLTLTWGFAF